MLAPSAGDLYGRPQTEPLRHQDMLRAPPSPNPDKADAQKAWRQTLGYGMCSTLVVALLAGLLAVFVFHSQSGVRARALCVSTECKRFAHEIKASLNSSESPCRDFYGYVCGQWNKSHPEHISEAHRRRSDFMAEEAELLLNCSVSRSNQSVLEKAASLFRVSARFLPLSRCPPLQECVNGSDADLEMFRTRALPGLGLRWPSTNASGDPLLRMAELSFNWQLPFLENTTRRLQAVEQHYLDYEENIMQREGLLEELTVTTHYIPRLWSANSVPVAGPYSWLTLERCLELTSSLFGVSAWTPLLLERVTGHTRDGAVLLLDAIERSLKARLSESHWMDSRSVDVAQRTIEGVKTAVGHPAEVGSSAVRYKLYNTVPDVTQGFLETWLSTANVIRSLLTRSWGYTDVYTYDPMWHGVQFYEDSNTLAMPDQNLVMPYFHQAAPRAVNMGGLGALVTRAFMQ
ncbi:unnamed protein product, partial [Ixodes hexagonus]